MNDDALNTYYDCFNISVKDVKIYLDRDIPRNHLLTPLNMDSKIYASIFPSDPKLPTIVLKAEIPKVATKLASSDIRKSYYMMENLVVDSYNELKEQDEFFKDRRAEMKAKEAAEDSEDSPEAVIAKSAGAKLEELEGAAGTAKTQEEADEEFFDEKTKLELLQKVNVLVSLQIGDVQFSLVNDDHYTKTNKLYPIIVSNIGGAYLYLQQRKWDLTMEAGLSEVLVEDHVCDSTYLSEKPYLMKTGGVLTSVGAAPGHGTGKFVVDF